MIQKSWKRKTDQWAYYQSWLTWKITFKTIHKQWLVMKSDCNLILNHKFGFRKHHSTTIQRCHRAGGEIASSVERKQCSTRCQSHFWHSLPRRAHVQIENVASVLYQISNSFLQIYLPCLNLNDSFQIKYTTYSSYMTERRVNRDNRNLVDWSSCGLIPYNRSTAKNEALPMFFRDQALLTTTFLVLQNTTFLPQTWRHLKSECIADPESVDFVLVF